MYSKVLAVVCIQLAVFNAVSSQCINRYLPETIIPLNPCPNPCSCPKTSPIILNPNPCNPCSNTLYPSQIPATTTIIQDNTVANNLANALQLLVVSNLLSNTLPLPSQIELVPTGCSSGIELLPTCAQQAIEVVPTCASAAPAVEIANPYGFGYGYSYVV